MCRDTLDSVEVFHLLDKGQGWSLVTGASLPVPVRSMAAAVVGDKIYIIGESSTSSFFFFFTLMGWGFCRHFSIRKFGKFGPP